MRISIPLLVFAAACGGMRGSPATPASARAAVSPLVGIWRVTQVNGHALPAPSPQEPNVTVERASLMLQANRDYTLSITAHTGAQPATEQSQSGRYSTGDHTLTLAPESGRATRFAYTFSAAGLTLREDGGTVYTLVRG